MTSPPASLARDQQFMKRALVLARRSGRSVLPNPNVGALVVADGKVVAEGWHERAGAAHAETIALERAGDRARGATLYVTLEPCNHFGKTPPCTEAIIRAGISRVVFALEDPNPVAGGGAGRLGAAGVEVSAGVMRDTARRLVAPWLNWITSSSVLVERVEIPTAIFRASGPIDIGRCRRWVKRNIVPYFDDVRLAEAGYGAALHAIALELRQVTQRTEVEREGAAEHPLGPQRVLHVVEVVAEEEPKLPSIELNRRNRCLAELSKIVR